MWAICVANEWPWIPSGLLRKLRALSIARPKRARHATSRSCTSGEIRTSATSSKTSGVTVNRPTSVLPARAPSITWSDRSSVKTSESNRGLVMTSVRRSSTLSRTAVSAIAVPRWPISSLNRNFSSWSSMPGWYTGRTRALARVRVGTAAARGPGNAVDPGRMAGVHERCSRECVVRRTRAAAPAGTAAPWRLRVEAPQSGRVGDTLDRNQVGRGPHVDLLEERHGQHLAEGAIHDLLELRVDHRLAPVVPVEVLDPLEVADGDAPLSLIHISAPTRLG